MEEEVGGGSYEESSYIRSISNHSGKKVDSLYCCSKYLTSHAILCFYKSQIRPEIKHVVVFLQELPSPRFPIWIESKSVTDSLEMTNYSPPSIQTAP